jgi:hypothetical protein
MWPFSILLRKRCRGDGIPRSHPVESDKFKTVSTLKFIPAGAIRHTYRPTNSSQGGARINDGRKPAILVVWLSRQPAHLESERTTSPRHRGPSRASWTESTAISERSKHKSCQESFGSNRTPAEDLESQVQRSALKWSDTASWRSPDVAVIHSVPGGGFTAALLRADRSDS